MSVELDYVVPASDLADYVTLFYSFRTDQPVFEDLERADHAQLRFILTNGHAEYRFATGVIDHAPASHLKGPTTYAATAVCAGPIELYGMGLTPGGWAALAGDGASALVNRCVDAAGRFAGLEEMLVALRKRTGQDDRIAVLEGFVRGLVAGRARAAVTFARQIDAWLAGAPSPVLEDMETIAGLSRRQVERRCNELYGAPPKVLARKYRALRAAVALVMDGESVHDLVGRGFYDQSHLIREIKQFTGCTPRQLRANPSPLAQLTIGGRSALEGRVIPLVSET